MFGVDDSSYLIFQCSFKKKERKIDISESNNQG